MRCRSTFLFTSVLAVSGFCTTSQADAQLFHHSSRTYGVGTGDYNGPGFGAHPNSYNGSHGLGLGWFAHRSPAPRPKPNFDYNPQVSDIETGEPPLIGDADAESTDAGVLHVEVRVPIESAVVFVNDQPTKQTGPLRVFVSPSLPKQGNYQYDVRVEWVVNGKKMTRAQTVSGKPGERVVADLTR